MTGALGNINRSGRSHAVKGKREVSIDTFVAAARVAIFLPGFSIAIVVER
jgi:hypothetical protein